MKVKDKIKNYWETRSPQTWYSKKKPMSTEWFNELEYQRYHVYYEYLPKVAEFENHQNEKVLEIGVGVGTDLLQFAKNGSQVSGIDLTDEAIRITKSNLKRLNLKWDEIKRGDAENLPFEDNTFDVVYSFGVLHHTPNTLKTIEEVNRVLKPEGQAIIMLYSAGWKHLLKRILINGILCGKLLKYGYQKTININSEVHGNSPLTKVYLKGSIKKLFKIFGEVEISKYRLGEYFDYAPYKTRKLPAFFVNILYLFSFDKLFGENWIIKAKKTKKTKRMSVFKTILKP